MWGLLCHLKQVTTPFNEEFKRGWGTHFKYACVGRLLFGLAEHEPCRNHGCAESLQWMRHVATMNALQINLGEIEEI